MPDAVGTNTATAPVTLEPASRRGDDRVLLVLTCGAYGLEPAFATWKCAVRTVVAPLVGTTSTVMVWAPLATSLVSQGFAAIAEPPRKSYGAVLSTCVGVPVRPVSSSQNVAR